MNETQDELRMQIALTLARRELGCVAPNPAVGCVLYGKEGEIIGRGWTQKGGRPHAEMQALKQAKKYKREIKGASAYVTLEPCAHYGETEPCAKHLIEAGVSRVVVAVQDPDKRVSGRGISMLRDAGIEVAEGVLEKEAKILNRGFFLRTLKNRPLVTLKVAQTQNGFLRREKGTSPHITNELSRRVVHLMRAEHDAILVGSGTVLQDDPSLDCRLEGMEGMSPIPVVADRKGLVPKSAKLTKSPHLIISKARTVYDILSDLAKQGITRVMLEGGIKLAQAFIKADLVDDIVLFTAPIMSYVKPVEENKSDIEFIGIESLEQSDRYISIGSEEKLGDAHQIDVVTFWRRR